MGRTGRIIPEKNHRCTTLHTMVVTDVEAPAEDDNEIDLDDDEEEEEEEEEKEEEGGEEEKEKEKVDTNKKVAESVGTQEKSAGKGPPSLKERMRLLKMKMNQARQLNRREVLREGERLGSEEGRLKERRRQVQADKKHRQERFDSQHAKALSVAEQMGIDGKHLVEQAGDSEVKARRKREKAETNRFSVNDYHNPEGQHRNYARNLRSLPRDLERSSTETYNPVMASTNDKSEAEGARRLANEMKRRIEKKQNKRKKMEFESSDVSYINQRNKRFNEKISRNFDKHTAEIRQNLERGTAL